MNPSKNRTRYPIYILLATVSVIAVSIRCLGRDIITADFENCLNLWHLDMLHAGPGIDALLAYTGDYPMPYAFIIWLLGKLPIPFLYSWKLFNVLFDFALAVTAGKVVKQLKPGHPYSFVLGFCITLLLPNVILNSGFWGQCDCVYTTFLLAAFYFWLRKKYPAVMLMLGIAFSFKLQSIFFMPFLLIAYWLERKFSILQFLLIPVTMFVMNIPAILAGYSPLITFTKYIGLTTECPWLYYYYPNIWFFYQIRPYYRFGTSPILLTVVVLLIFVLLLVKKKVRLNQENALPILLWTAYTCAFFLPAMHERYGYFMELLAVIMAIVNIRSLWIPLIMIACTLPKYLFAVGIGENPLSIQMAEAFGNSVLYVVYTCVLWSQLFQRNEHRHLLKSEKEGKAYAEI